MMLVLYGYIMMCSFFIFIIYINIVQTFGSTLGFLIFMVAVIVLGFLEKQQQKKNEMSRRDRIFKELILLLFAGLICLFPSLVFESPFPDLTDSRFLTTIGIAILGIIISSTVKYLLTKDNTI